MKTALVRATAGELAAECVVHLDNMSPAEQCFRVLQDGLLFGETMCEVWGVEKVYVEPLSKGVPVGVGWFVNKEE